MWPPLLLCAAAVATAAATGEIPTEVAPETRDRRLSACDDLWADLSLSRAMDGDGDDDQSGSAAPEPALDGLSQGAKARDFLKWLRGGTDEFYEDQLRFYTIDRCDYTGETIYAQQHTCDDDHEGSCVRYSDTPAGCCEVPEDCYWEAVGSDPGSQTQADRGRKYTAEEKGLADTQVDEYLTGFVYVLAPGIVLMALTFLACVGFIVGRYLLGRCGGRVPSHVGYTRKQRLLPVGVFLFFTVGIVVCAALAYSANETAVTDGLAGTFDGSADCLDDLGAWAHDAAQPLEFVQDSLGDAVADINAALDDTSFVSAGLEGLRARMNLYDALYSDREGLESLGDDVDAALAAFDDGIVPIVDDLDATVDTLRGDLEDQQGAIDDAVGDATGMLDELRDVADDTHANIDDMRGDLTSRDDVREAGVMAVFALSLAVVALGLLGIIAGLLSHRLRCLVSLLHLTWLLGTVVCMVGFLVASVLLATAIVFTDLCAFTDIITRDFVPTMGSEAGDVLNACFADESLLVALNMTEELDFADALSDEFAAVTDLDIAGDFAGAMEPVDDIEALVLGFDAQDGVDALNRLSWGGCSPPHNYTVANISAPWLDYRAEPRVGGENGTAFVARVTADCAGGPYDAAYDAAAAGVYMQLNIGNGTVVGADWTFATAVGRHADDFQANLTALQGDLADISAGVVGDVVDAVELFTCTMGCGWLGDCWGDIHTAMCDDLLGGLAQVALAIWLCSLFMIPIIIASMVAVKRLKGKTATVVVDLKGTTDWGGKKFAWGD